MLSLLDLYGKTGGDESVCIWGAKQLAIPLILPYNRKGKEVYKPSNQHKTFAETSEGFDVGGEG